MLILKIFSFLLLHWNIVNCDYYSSVVGLEDLLTIEGNLVANLENYIDSMEDTHDEILQFLDEVDRIHAEIESDPADFYENPLSAVKLIKRVVFDWKGMEDLVLKASEAEAYANQITRLNDQEWKKPTTDDLQGAVQGLQRLQKTYALQTKDLANGIIMDRKFNISLSASDCYQIGLHLYNSQIYLHALEWLTQARIRLENDLVRTKNVYEFPYLNDLQILTYLAPCYFNLGNSKMAMLLNEQILEKEPENAYSLQNKPLYVNRNYEERRTLLPLPPVVPATDENSNSDELYAKTCREELKQTPKEQRKLRCRYVNNNVPFCSIAPFKMEELSLEPFVAYYHEAIYENEIAYIINATQYKIERSQVGGITSHFSDIRISKNTWLWYNENPLLANLEQRLEDITGLTIKTGEALQVANYGVGGHYGPHYDFNEEPDYDFDGKGNRILTALFYINDVELGGSTAFPKLHLAARPIRRSLVLWYNLHKSLDVDYRMLHAACPVIKGSKWICNEWFHEKGQEFHRPCDLVRDNYKSFGHKVQA